MLVEVGWRLVTLMSCSLVVSVPVAETKGLGRLGELLGGVTYGWHHGCFRPEVFLSDFAPGPKAWCATIEFACSSRRVLSLVSSHVVPDMWEKAASDIFRHILTRLRETGCWRQSFTVHQFISSSWVLQGCNSATSHRHVLLPGAPKGLPQAQVCPRSCDCAVMFANLKDNNRKKKTCNCTL